MQVRTFISRSSTQGIGTQEKIKGHRKTKSPTSETEPLIRKIEGTPFPGSGDAARRRAPSERCRRRVSAACRRATGVPQSKKSVRDSYEKQIPQLLRLVSFSEVAEEGCSRWLRSLAATGQQEMSEDCVARQCCRLRARARSVQNKSSIQALSSSKLVKEFRSSGTSRRRARS